MDRFDLTPGQLQGPKLTHGRVSDRSSPFLEDTLPVGSLSIADLGYLDWGRIAARRAAGSYTLTRAQARTLYWTKDGQIAEDRRAASTTGRADERTDGVRVGDEHRHLMRLLILRVPEEVAQHRHAALAADARATWATCTREGLETSRLDDLAHRCACEPPQLAGGSCSSARTMADGDAL